MSIVVGVVTDTEVVIAADTSLTGRYQTFGESKIARVGDAVVGWAGNSLWGTWARRWTEPLQSYEHVEFFAASWRGWLKELALPEDEAGGSFLVATTEGLFEITSSGAVCDAAPYGAIGAGDGIALGALHVGQAVLDGLQEEAEIRKYSILGVAIEAVQAAIHHHPACGGTVEWERVEREKS